MNRVLFLLSIFLASNLCGADAKPGEQSRMLERFYMRGGLVYEGIWNPTNSQIHLVKNSNHVANLTIKTNDIVKRVDLGDAREIQLLTDLQAAEKVVAYYVQAVNAAKKRAVLAVQNRDRLHQTYKGKNLDPTTYGNVMVRYKAADDEITNSQAALASGTTTFESALANYQKLGGKTDYKAQIQ